MELQTISQVSKQFRISTRTLRYYEQIGLIQSTMKEDYSYRTYDEGTILRLKQIIVLRKLRIPLKSIAKILLTENTAFAIEIFEQNLSEIGDEITALETIKIVIQSFIERLNIKNTKLQLLDDESLLEIVDSLTTSKINFKEDKTMDDLIKAGEKLFKLNGLRIIEIPDFRAVSSGSQPFDKLFGEGEFDKWMNANDHLRRDCFYADADFMWHEQDGYATWIWAVKDNVTAADCAPYELIEFKGGMYAVATADENDGADLSEVYNGMTKWIENSGVFEMDGPPRYGMGHMVGVGLTKALGWAQQEIFLPIKHKTK